jgi:SAM-dependent methyltransferase
MEYVNTEQAEFWASMAPTWVEMDDQLERTAGTPGRMAMDCLDLRPGQRVVDLGCGTGPTTVELSSRVGPDGSIVGLDIAEGMLDRARGRAAASGVTNVTFVHADVEAHDLGSGEFDAAFSRFGVMFYSDPIAAFRSIRKGLKPEGRLSFVCWQDVFANEWMLVPGMAVMSVTGTPPPVPEPGAPGPFSLCDADRVRSILDVAGFKRVDVSSHNDVLTASVGELPDYAALSLRVGAAREALEDADEATRQKAYGSVVDALHEKVLDGVLRLTRGYLVVTALA